MRFKIILTLAVLSPLACARSEVTGLPQGVDPTTGGTVAGTSATTSTTGPSATGVTGTVSGTNGFTTGTTATFSSGTTGTSGTVPECGPCNSDDDCASDDPEDPGLPGRCVPTPSGATVCGYFCDTTHPCTDGFRCVSELTHGGNPVFGCVPDQGCFQTSGTTEGITTDSTGTIGTTTGFSSSTGTTGTSGGGECASCNVDSDCAPGGFCIPSGFGGQGGNCSQACGPNDSCADPNSSCFHQGPYSGCFPDSLSCQSTSNTTGTTGVTSGTFGTTATTGFSSTTGTTGTSGGGECAPCSNSSQCGSDATCIHLSGWVQSYCAVSCGDFAPCVVGEVCVQLGTNPDGTQSTVCLPDSFSCDGETTGVSGTSGVGTVSVSTTGTTGPTGTTGGTTGGDCQSQGCGSGETCQSFASPNGTDWACTCNTAGSAGGDSCANNGSGQTVCDSNSMTCRFPEDYEPCNRNSLVAACAPDYECIGASPTTAGTCMQVCTSTSDCNLSFTHCVFQGGVGLCDVDICGPTQFAIPQNGDFYGACDLFDAGDGNCQPFDDGDGGLIGYCMAEGPQATGAWCPGFGIERAYQCVAGDICLPTGSRMVDGGGAGTCYQTCDATFSEGPECLGSSCHADSSQGSTTPSPGLCY